MVSFIINFLSGPPPVADVKSLTHYGEPYDGNTRFFRSTLFVAAVRACYGESCLLHGVEWMPPKVGYLLNISNNNSHLHAFSNVYLVVLLCIYLSVVV